MGSTRLVAGNIYVPHRCYAWRPKLGRPCMAYAVPGQKRCHKHGGRPYVNTPEHRAAKSAGAKRSCALQHAAHKAAIAAGVLKEYPITTYKRAWLKRHGIVRKQPKWKQDLAPEERARRRARVPHLQEALARYRAAGGKTGPKPKGPPPPSTFPQERYIERALKEIGMEIARIPLPSKSPEEMTDPELFQENTRLALGIVHRILSEPIDFLDLKKTGMIVDTAMRQQATMVRVRSDGLRERTSRKLLDVLTRAKLIEEEMETEG